MLSGRLSLTIANSGKPAAMIFVPFIMLLLIGGGTAERKLASKDEPCVTAGVTLNSTASLSKFAAALETIGVLDLLEDPRFKATVFAPNNDAWERLPQQLGLPDETALMGDPRLGTVLLYHILPFKAKVKKGLSKARNVPTLLGQMVTLAPHPIADAVAPDNGSAPTISALPKARSNFTQVKGSGADNVVDILSIQKTCRAVIDIVDGVLLPEFNLESMKSSKNIVKEWKDTLTVLEARRQQDVGGRAKGQGHKEGHAGGSGVHAPAAAHAAALQKKLTGKKVKVTISARILALFGLRREGEHKNRIKDAKKEAMHGLEHRKTLGTDASGSSTALRRRWAMLDRLQPGALMRAVHGRISSLVTAGRKTTPKQASPAAQHPLHHKGKKAPHGSHGHAKPLVEGRSAAAAAPVSSHESEDPVTAGVEAKAAFLQFLYNETLASAPSPDTGLDADVALVSGDTELVGGGVDQDEMAEHLFDLQNMTGADLTEEGGLLPEDPLAENRGNGTVLTKSASHVQAGEAKKS